MIQLLLSRYANGLAYAFYPVEIAQFDGEDLNKSMKHNQIE